MELLKKTHTLENFQKEPSGIEGSFNLPIVNHSLFLRRQGYYDGDGRYLEISGILGLVIPATVINGKKTLKFNIYYRTAGSVRGKAYYMESDNSWNLESPGEDMAAWIAALNNTNKKSLFVEVLEDSPEYISLYLSI